MNIRSNFAKASLAGVAGVMALAGAVSVPSFASAQQGPPPQAGYYDNNGYYYDPCQRSTTNRTTAGGLLGALAGAAIGSNVAGHRVRTEGAVLGGLAGAAVGAGIGHSTAACQPGQSAAPPPPAQAYYNNPPPPPPGEYYDRSAYDERASREYYGSSYPVAERPAANAASCTLAESPIYLPDGRVQKRFVRVCQDSSGRYQVVD